MVKGELSGSRCSMMKFKTSLPERHDFWCPPIYRPVRALIFQTRHGSVTRGGNGLHRYQHHFIRLATSVENRVTKEGLANVIYRGNSIDVTDFDCRRWYNGFDGTDVRYLTASVKTELSPVLWPIYATILCLFDRLYVHASRCVAHFGFDLLEEVRICSPFDWLDEDSLCSWFLLRFSLKIFSQQILHRKIRFTACGFFVLDFSLLHTTHCFTESMDVLGIEVWISGSVVRSYDCWSSDYLINYLDPVLLVFKKPKWDTQLFLVPNAREQLMIFSQQLLNRKVQFTACGFFVLDRTLLYSIVGAVTTYMGKSTAVIASKFLNQNISCKIKNELKIFSQQLLNRRVQFTTGGFFVLDRTLLYSMYLL
uniref:Gustatory receptor n=1 Tax=Timema poppense TaxID=170557 RepID=A0A7R9H670_TIMPO|nr:unnamed protein product [Timema poppensis]